MKCHDCGAEVENLGYLKKHKTECPGKMPDVHSVVGNYESTPVEALDNITPSTGFIPIAMVPEEWRVAADGQMVVLRAIGRMTSAGVVVEEVEML